MEYPHTRIPHMDTPLDNLPKQGLFGHIILMWLIFVQFWIVLTSHGHDFLASLNWTTQSSSQILLLSHLSMHRPHLLPCSSIQAFQWSFSFFLSEQTQIGFGQSTQPWMQSMSQGQSEHKIKNLNSQDFEKYMVSSDLRIHPEHYFSPTLWSKKFYPLELLSSHLRCTQLQLLRNPLNRLYHHHK